MERYLVICAPALGGASFERLLSREGNFFDALTNPELGLERLHPLRKDAPTFPIWMDPESTRLLVPDRRLLTAFESPERNQGLLFLNESPPSDLRLTGAGGLCRYSRLAAADLGLPQSLFFSPPEGDASQRAHRHGRLTGRLLRETRKSAEALTHLKLDVETPGRPADGWMNPIILRIELAGDAFSSAADSLAGDTRRVLAKLLGEVEILGLVPDFTREDDRRVRAWSLAIAHGDGPLSAMQQLVVGGSWQRSLEPWPFVALDALGGKFVLRGHGRVGGFRETPTYSWCPPAGAPSNTRWLGQQLVNRWGEGRDLVGVPKAHNDSPAAGAKVAFDILDTPPNARLIDETSVLETGGTVLSVLPGRFSPHERERAVASPMDFVRMCAGLPGYGEQHPLIRFLLDFLGELATLQIPFPADLHRPWYQFIGRDRLAASPSEMFNDVLERLAAPRSPIQIRLPDAGQAEQVLMLDLLTAVPAAALGWFWSQIRQKPAPESARTLTLSMGWWNSWHECLFDDPADVRLDFRVSHFELGYAILGAQALGGGAADLRGPVRMRFTTPV